MMIVRENFNLKGLVKIMTSMMFSKFDIPKTFLHLTKKKMKQEKLNIYKDNYLNLINRLLCKW